MLEIWNAWEQIVAFVAFLAVVGWCGEMARQARRTADALEEIVSRMRMRQDRLDF